MNNFEFNTRIIFNDQRNTMNFTTDNPCEKCGTRLSEIKRDGIVGCINCYKIFEEEIKQIIMRKQGTINHIGQIPSKHFSKVKLKEKIIELENEKEQAIKDENFIAAESIKNQIEKLKGEL